MYIFDLHRRFITSVSSKFLVVLCLFLSSHFTIVYGQQGDQYGGTILSADTSLLLRGINVLNLTLKRHTVSDAYGKFVLEYKQGDTVEFRHDHWETKIVYGSGLKDSIFLQKRGIVLDEIVITRNRHNKEIDELKDIQKEKNKKGGIYYGGRPPIALLNPFGGKPITFFYELFSKNGKRARQMEKDVQYALRESKVDSAFNRITVKKITAINDGELPDFMKSYRPTFEQVQSWDTYDLYFYIQKSYDSFRTIKVQQNLH
jgi:hypothetical protein